MEGGMGMCETKVFTASLLYGSITGHNRGRERGREEGKELKTRPEVIVPKEGGDEGGEQ